jgi:hypothetical protein
LVFGLTLVMTDVDGPLVPVLRFSSLLIRGAEADAGRDEQALKVGCNMAQAFEIPKGVTGQRILAYLRSARA